MFRKLLILSASAGAGHARAAEGIERAVKDLGAADEVRHIDVLQFTTKVFRTVYSKAYIDMVNKAPQVLGWLYDPAEEVPPGDTVAPAPAPAGTPCAAPENTVEIDSPNTPRLTRRVLLRDLLRCGR